VLKDTKLIGVALEAIENILTVGDTISKTQKSAENPFVQMVEEAEGIDRLEELQQHENNDIYQKSMKILEAYFSAEEDHENIAPNISANHQSFSFSALAPVPNGGFVF